MTGDPLEAQGGVVGERRRGTQAGDKRGIFSSCCL